MMIKNVKVNAAPSNIKELHFLLKSGTSDSRLDWFGLGGYKKLANEVGGIDTTAPSEVAKEMKFLLVSYNTKQEKTLRILLIFTLPLSAYTPSKTETAELEDSLCLANA